MMQEVIDEYKLSADEVIYIGDAPTDIDAARQVGVKISFCIVWNKNRRRSCKS